MCLFCDKNALNTDERSPSFEWIKSTSTSIDEIKKILSSTDAPPLVQHPLASLLYACLNSSESQRIPVSQVILKITSIEATLRTAKRSSVAILSGEENEWLANDEMRNVVKDEMIQILKSEHSNYHPGEKQLIKSELDRFREEEHLQRMELAGPVSHTIAQFVLIGIVRVIIRTNFTMV